MGSCVSRSASAYPENRTSAKQTATPETDDSNSAEQVRSSELLRVAEPSDGSFAAFYPELKFSSQKLPNNWAVDATRTLPLVERMVSSNPTPRKPYRNDVNRTEPIRQTSLTESSEKSSESNPIAIEAASTPPSSMPVPMYAREA